jgi:hypothetical protein
MADGSIPDEELAELVRRTEDATSAYMRGDMDHYLALTRHARGYTLMNPFGGAPARYDDRSESVAAGASPRRPARPHPRSAADCGACPQRRAVGVGCCYRDMMNVLPTPQRMV